MSVSTPGIRVVLKNRSYCREHIGITSEIHKEICIIQTFKHIDGQGHEEMTNLTIFDFNICIKDGLRLKKIGFKIQPLSKIGI